MKKDIWLRSILSLAVVVFLCLAVCGSSQAGCVYSWDYESDTLGLPPADWVEGYSPPMTRAQAAAQGVYVQVQDTVACSGLQSCWFGDASNQISVDGYHMIAAAHTVTLEYCILSHNSDEEAVFVQLSGDGGNDFAVGFGTAAGGGSAGYLGIIGWHSGWIETALLPYEEDVWYYVRRELDCLTGTGYFYVENTVNTALNATYVTGPDDAIGYADRIRTITSGSLGADAYLDNISVEGVPVPAPGAVVLGILGVGFAAVIRKIRRR